MGRRTFAAVAALALTAFLLLLSHPGRPAAAPVGTTPGTARVWLTTVNPDASAAKLLEQQPNIPITVAPAAGPAQELLGRRAAAAPTVGDDPADPPVNTTSKHEAKLVCQNGTHDCTVVPPAVPPPWGADGGHRVRVAVDRGTVLQKMVGFGAAMPQSSAVVLKRLKNKEPGTYMTVMKRLFSTEDGAAGLTMMRFPIGSCDFSRHFVTLDDVAGDFHFSSFALDGDSQMIIEILQDAKKINPELTLVGSPWSPPAWFKAEGNIRGLDETNTLRNETHFYVGYAEYLALAASTFAKAGLHLDYMTLQNEPLNTPKYPGMYLTAINEAKLAKLVRARLPATTKLLAYDHNWDHPEYPVTAIRNAGGAFAGIAWHCYAGDMAPAQEVLYAAYPDLETHFVECTGSYPDGVCDITRGMEGFGWNHEWDMTNVLLGSVGHWAQSGVKWIVATDENCGPRSKPVGNLRPFVSIPSNTTSEMDVKWNQDFYSMAHMSRFILPGSRRLTTTATGKDSVGIIESFIDTAGKTVTLVVVNKDHTADMPITVTDGAKEIRYLVPAWGTVVLQWDL